MQAEEIGKRRIHFFVRFVRDAVQDLPAISELKVLIVNSYRVHDRILKSQMTKSADGHKRGVEVWNKSRVLQMVISKAKTVIGNDIASKC